MGVLSTRESAFIFWVLIFLLFLFLKKELRYLLFKLIKDLFSKKLSILLLVYFLYVSLITVVFAMLPFWNTIYIKDIIIWSLFSGSINYINAMSRDSDENYIRDLIIKNFKIIIIFNFIFNTFTLNFYVELLIFPILVVLPLCSVINNNISKIVDYITGIIGIYIFWGTLKVLLNQFNNLNLFHTLISFLIPIMYFFLTLPLIYVVLLYYRYDSLFLRIKFKCANNVIGRVRCIEVLKTCNISLKKVLHFEKDYLNKIYRKMTDEEFYDLIYKFKNNL